MPSLQIKNNSDVETATDIVINTTSYLSFYTSKFNTVKQIVDSTTIPATHVYRYNDANYVVDQQGNLDATQHAGNDPSEVDFTNGISAGGIVVGDKNNIATFTAEEVLFGGEYTFSGFDYASATPISLLETTYQDLGSTNKTITLQLNQDASSLTSHSFSVVVDNNVSSPVVFANLDLRGANTLFLFVRPGPTTPKLSIVLNGSVQEVTGDGAWTTAVTGTRTFHELFFDYDPSFAKLSSHVWKTDVAATSLDDAYIMRFINYKM